MRDLADIAGDIRDRLAGNFSTVRFSTAESSPQLLNELRAISENRLPAIVIVIDSGSLSENRLKESLKITLVLIDRFVAGSDDKALSVWRSLAKLRAAFPPVAVEINGVHYLPSQFYAASGDPKYACFALELEAVQRV